MTEVNLALVSLWDEVDEGFGDIDGRTVEDVESLIRSIYNKRINEI